MFFAGSRYLSVGTRMATTPSGQQVLVTNVYRAPTNVPLKGLYPRKPGQRLDAIANHFLSDPTAFWQLCDADDAVVPDALANRALVGIP
jgi:hypothetical protein